MKNKPLNLPGQTLDDKLIDLVVDGPFFCLISTVFFAILVLIEWLRFYFPTKTSPWFITIFWLMYTMYCVYKVKQDFKKIKYLRKGRDGERSVGQYLENLRSEGCYIFHDIQGTNFNIDHVVISPKGIFTIETKNWTRKNPNDHIMFDGSKITASEVYNSDVIIQVRAQSNWLMNILEQSTGRKIKIQPVIVFPGWFVDSKSSNLANEKGIWLLNPKALPSYIRKADNSLNVEDLNLFKFHLERYISSSK